jgi:hypothetical protein
MSKAYRFDQVTNKRVIVFHPIIFAIFPVLAALSREIDWVVASEAVRPAMVSMMAAIVILVILKFILRDVNRAGFITSLLLIYFLSYGYSYKLPQYFYFSNLAISRHIILFIVWAVIILLTGSNWVWRRVRPQVITNFMNILSVIYLIIPIRLIMIFLIAVNKDPLTGWTLPERQALMNSQIELSTIPDIYYIILDGYGREDVLQEVYKFDNSEFLRYLENKGFFVAKESRSNYIQTSLSLASSMNFEYLAVFEDIESANRYPMRDLVHNSRVRSLFKQFGYRMVGISSQFIVTDIRNADLYIPFNTSSISDFEGAFLATTIAQVFVEDNLVDIPILGYKTHRDRILFAFDQLAESSHIQGPKFVFAHIITPHPPFVFDSKGNPLEPEDYYFMGDGSHFRGTNEEYISGYREQIRFANKKVIDMVDTIIANSSRPFVIILQADHGPGAYLDYDRLDNTCLKERTGILNAYYMTENKTELLYNSITPVNSFRVILNTYFGLDLPILEDRVFFSPFGRPYDFVDITDISNQSCILSEK